MKYKITKKDSKYHVYERFLFVFWNYRKIFNCLEDAEIWVEKDAEKEEVIKYL